MLWVFQVWFRWRYVSSTLSYRYSDFHYVVKTHQFDHQKSSISTLASSFCTMALPDTRYVVVPYTTRSGRKTKQGQMICDDEISIRRDDMTLIPTIKLSFTVSTESGLANRACVSSVRALEGVLAQNKTRHSWGNFYIHSIKMNVEIPP